jgi:hypothetical protein
MVSDGLQIVRIVVEVVAVGYLRRMAVPARRGSVRAGALRVIFAGQERCRHKIALFPRGPMNFRCASVLLLFRLGPWKR